MFGADVARQNHHRFAEAGDLRGRPSAALFHLLQGAHPDARMRFFNLVHKHNGIGCCRIRSVNCPPSSLRHTPQPRPTNGDAALVFVFAHVPEKGILRYRT